MIVSRRDLGAAATAVGLLATLKSLPTDKNDVNGA